MEKVPWHFGFYRASLRFLESIAQLSSTLKGRTLVRFVPSDPRRTFKDMAWEFTYVDLNIGDQPNTVDVVRKIDDLEDQIRELGLSGWEPVGHTTWPFRETGEGGPSFPSAKHRLMFKREAD